MHGTAVRREVRDNVLNAREPAESVCVKPCIEDEGTAGDSKHTHTHTESLASKMRELQATANTHTHTESLASKMRKLQATAKHTRTQI